MRTPQRLSVWDEANAGADSLRARITVLVGSLATLVTRWDLLREDERLGLLDSAQRSTEGIEHLVAELDAADPIVGHDLRNALLVITLPVGVALSGWDGRADADRFDWISYAASHRRALIRAFDDGVLALTHAA